MRSAMVISAVADDIQAIHNALGAAFRFCATGDVPAALQILDGARYELVFVDLDLLSAYAAANGFEPHGSSLSAPLSQHRGGGHGATVTNTRRRDVGQSGRP
jgi:hypothetical protein